MPAEVEYGSLLLTFEVERKDRKTLAIEVHPDLSINVLAPPQITIEEIKSRVLKRAAWIVKQRNFFDQFLPRMPKKEYVPGESHLYLGRKYILAIKHCETESVKLVAGKLIVSLKEGMKDTDRIRNLLAAWYKSHAIRIFDRTLENSLLLFKKFDLEKPRFQVNRMKARWGSCSPSGKITLNPEIIKAPTKCIEYIVIHELCHLVKRNHDKQFYHLLEAIMPDWRRWKLRLESTEM